MTAVQLALCEPTWDPDPDPDDDEDGPWCGSRTPGLLPEQRAHTVTVDVKGGLL